jgi:hypothetical protein
MALSPYILDYLLDNPFENNYLEIGIYDGGIISQVANTYPDKTCYGIDPFIEDGCTGHLSGCQVGEYLSLRKENTMKTCSNCVIYEMTSAEFHQKLTDAQVKEMNIGCVVIDGAHNADAVKNDVHLALKLLKKGGLIIFDDWQMESVRDTALAELSGVTLVHEFTHLGRLYMVI